MFLDHGKTICTNGVSLGWEDIYSLKWCIIGSNLFIFLIKLLEQKESIFNWFMKWYSM